MMPSQSVAQIEEQQGNRPQTENRQSIENHAFTTIYCLALATAISTWFLAIRAPLWLDETYSYWQISKGFWGIWEGRFVTLCFPAYSYILWFSTKIIGSSEMALRAPSILATLGAAYLLYLAARELFDKDVAIIAAIVFCLHPIVIFAAIDVRPYAFAVLATNAAIFIVLRLRHNDSNWLAALFGLSAACIVWFHYLFATILPALVVCFFVVKAGKRKIFWRQFGVSLAAFTLAILPVIPCLRYVFHTRGDYVFEVAPSLIDLIWTFTPGLGWDIAGLAVLVAVAWALFHRQIHFQGWQILFCASLALISVLILFGVSVGTTTHCFTPRHRMDAVPGIALCWAMLYGAIRPRALRLLLCVGLVTVMAFHIYSTPYLRHHGYTWKYALEAAEKNSAKDNTPVLICSPFVETNVESNFITVPLESPKESLYYSFLSYYRLSSPVVPLPMALNNDAIRIGSQFLQEATKKHERFLAIAEDRSYETLDWLSQRAAGTYSVRNLGVYDRVEVLEFVPRSTLSPTP
jgi:mannosyltransferase